VSDVAHRGDAVVATVAVGPQSIVTGWSDGARRLLGDPPEAVGRAITDLLAVDASDEAWRALAEERVWSGTVALRSG
jgi:hypothetical protein